MLTLTDDYAKPFEHPRNSMGSKSPYHTLQNSKSSDADLFPLPPRNS